MSSRQPRPPRRRLLDRIRGSQAPTPATGYTPVSGGAASPGGTPMVMPLARVQIVAATGDYVTLGMESVEPIYTPDGAAIAATSPGRWAQLAAAGNPHPRSQRAARAPIAGR